jgi:hypothetical protein
LLFADFAPEVFMRCFSRPSAARTAKAVLFGGLAVVVLGGVGFAPAAIAAHPTRHRVLALSHAKLVAVAQPKAALPATTPATTPAVKAAAPKPVVVTPARVFATGNAQLDALLVTLPAVLFDAGAHVHFGYNPLDECCHAGGYNPGPNDVWVSERALSSSARLTYVTAHELGHSLHLHSARGAALTAAVAGAPVVRAGSPWDGSEKVADCIAWVLFPVQTAASGITYWNCPDPWRSQIRAALR